MFRALPRKIGGEAAGDCHHGQWYPVRSDTLGLGSPDQQMWRASTMGLRKEGSPLKSDRDIFDVSSNLSMRIFRVRRNISLHPNLMEIDNQTSFWTGLLLIKASAG